MKFSALALTLFAAAGLAAPVANAEAKAEAEAAPCFFDSLWNLESHVFGIDGQCDSCAGDWNGISLGVSAGIFLTPSGCLTYGNTIEGSVAFQGTIINGNLYANTPFIGSGLGCVNYGDDGRLYIVDNFSLSFGWFVQNNNVLPYGDNIWACPDDQGNHYLYLGGNHPQRKQIYLRRN